MDEREEMYQLYAKPVYRYLLGLCGSPQDAEEMTAETFLRAVQSIHRYNGGCQLRVWLCQIAKHVWYQELARRGRRALPLETAGEPADTAPGPDSALELAEDKLTLYRKMQALDDTTREVLYLRLSGELSFREIGDILGRSENWARVTFYRGKERLKKDGL